ncbi:cystatin-B-like [Dermacentor andersoni]|uniref:cystatin-B-like n=1 Tax=Dermacentor andersoni TaxID=34620 RepID=UPI002155B1EA|nr:cystatin-B-like [Dermacentor andersoni]
MPLCGGLSEEVKDADDTVKEICEKVRADVEAKLSKSFKEFAPLKYRTQLVNGVNYFVKVHVGDGQHIHVRAHKAFQGEISFSAVQENKTLEDPLEHFQ